MLGGVAAKMPMTRRRGKNQGGGIIPRDAPTKTRKKRLRGRKKVRHNAWRCLSITCQGVLYFFKMAWRFAYYLLLLTAIVLAIAFVPPDRAHLVWSSLGIFLGWCAYSVLDGGRVCCYSVRGHLLPNLLTQSSWLNLGLWKAQQGSVLVENPSNYASACENLCLCVGDHARLHSKDNVLDVGFGHGDEIAIWRKVYDVYDIIGVNISKDEVEYAKANISRYTSPHFGCTASLLALLKRQESNQFFASREVRAISGQKGAHSKHVADTKVEDQLSCNEERDPVPGFTGPTSDRESSDFAPSRNRSASVDSTLSVSSSGSNVTSSDTLQTSQSKDSDSPILDQRVSGIELLVGDATKLSMSDDTFSKVVSVDSAYYFNTRNRFFSEAFRVLAPGGRLCTADICLQQYPTTCFGKIVLFIMCLFTGIPRANMYSCEEYMSTLSQTGFTNVKCRETLDNDVFLGYANFIKQQKFKFKNVIRPSLFSTHSAASSFFSFVGRMGWLSFIVVTADKPSRNARGDLRVSPQLERSLRSASSLYQHA